MPSVLRKAILDTRIREWLRKERRAKNKPYWEIIYEIYKELKDSDFHTKYFDIQEKVVWMAPFPLDVDKEIREDASRRGLLGEFYKYLNLLIAEKLGLTTKEDTKPKKRNVNFKLSKGTYELLKVNKELGAYTRLSQAIEEAISHVDYDTLKKMIGGRERQLQKKLEIPTSNLLYEDTLKKIDMLRNQYENETGIKLTRSLVIDTALKYYFEQKHKRLTKDK